MNTYKLWILGQVKVLRSNEIDKCSGRVDCAPDFQVKFVNIGFDYYYYFFLRWYVKDDDSNEIFEIKKKYTNYIRFDEYMINLSVIEYPFYIRCHIARRNIIISQFATRNEKFVC